MFGLISRIVPTLSGAASYLPAGLTSIIPNPLGMLGKQPAATNDDVPRPKPGADTTTRFNDDDAPRPEPEADNTTTRSANVSSRPTISSFGRRATRLPREAAITVVDDEEFDSMAVRTLKASDRAAMIRMRKKRTRIVTPPPVPVEEPAVIESLPEDKQPGTPRKPADKHDDFKRWKEEEQKNLDKEEKKRLAAELKRTAENYKAVMKRLAEVEQEVKQRSKDNHQAHLARIAEVDQQVSKKADTEKVDQQGRDLASLRPLIDKAMEDGFDLQTQFKGLSEKVDLVEISQGAMKTAIDDNTKADLEIRGRVHVLENPPHVRQVDTTNLRAVATAIAADEQRQSNTPGCDPKEVNALTAKTDDHDQRIERLETAMGDVVPKMENVSPWFDSVGSEVKTHSQYISEHRDIPVKVKEIEAAHQRQGQLMDEALAKQKESFEEQLRQQKEASDKEKQDLKEAMQEQMRLSEASIRKECEERLASKDKEFAEHVAKTEAAKKEQAERQDQLEKKMNDLFAMMQGQNAAQQFPAPVQGQQQPPRALPPQPTPAPRGNGPWGATPTPSNQGQHPVPRPDVNMGETPDLDDEMKDAEPLQQQPFSQPPRQPSQPNVATPDDTPMTSGEPMIPNNRGSLGFGPKSQPMRSKQPFPGTGSSQLAPSAGQRSLFGSSTGVPKIPSGKQGFLNPTATPAKAPAPSKFGFSAPPPAVNKPQINWSASAGNLNFDPPADMDIDDDDVKPSQPKPRQPLVNAAPATHWAGKPAANNAPSANVGGSDTVMTNGSSLTAGGPPSTPAKPQAPAPTKPSAPKPAKKKADPMVQRKPGATPSKPAQTTNKAQTTQTQIASWAQKKQAAFAGNYGSTPAPKITVEENTVLPSEEPSEESPEFPIPGLTGAVNTSPFALKPKAPAPAPKPAPSSGWTTVIAGSDTPSPPYTPGSSVPRPVQPGSSTTSPIYSNPSPTHSPTSPAYNTAPSAPQPRTSPLANPAATSDTIESATTTNVFSKELEKPVEEPTKPAANTDDIQMSGAEATKPLKYEADVNRRKHAADVQIVPNDDAKIHRRESQDDAKSNKPQDGADAPKGDTQGDFMDDEQESRGDHPMQTDRPNRPVVKPKGKASKLTAAEIQRQKDDFIEQSAWDAMEKASANKGVQAAKAAADAADDVVDYADPNDVNDEDVHVTTMVPPTPSIRPTKYTINFFETWREHMLSEKSLTIEAAMYCYVSKEDVAFFIDKMRKEDSGNSLDFLVQQAKIPLGKPAYTKSEMVMLFSSWREEVFIRAILHMDLDEYDYGYNQTRGRFMIYLAHWFRDHKPDAV
ncbi:hypothetical protein FJTKL_13462 [Diaporthe vaccinii]|uniref:Uncharacterized protein n=1 Tax=Diaporthe vaccinii TaxID=105482 RepID=A0ABR4EAF9_9PEZI